MQGSRHGRPCLQSNHTRFRLTSLGARPSRTSRVFPRPDSILLRNDRFVAGCLLEGLGWSADSAPLRGAEPLVRWGRGFLQGRSATNACAGPLERLVRSTPKPRRRATALTGSSSWHCPLVAFAGHRPEAIRRFVAGRPGQAPSCNPAARNLGWVEYARWRKRAGRRTGGAAIPTQSGRSPARRRRSSRAREQAPPSRSLETVLAKSRQADEPTLGFGLPCRPLLPAQDLPTSKLGPSSSRA